MAKKLEKAQVGKIVKAAVKTAKKVKPRNSAGGPNEWMRGIEGNRPRTPGSPPTANMLKKAYAIGRVHGGGKGAMIGSGVGAAAGAAAGYAAGKKKMGGSLKPVDSSKNPGLSKLPTPVRNKMGYQKNGGAIKAKKK